MPHIAATINHFVSRALFPVAADALAAATFKLRCDRCTWIGKAGSVAATKVLRTGPAGSLNEITAEKLARLSSLRKMARPERFKRPNLRFVVPLDYFMDTHDSAS